MARQDAWRQVDIACVLCGEVSETGLIVTEEKLFATVPVLSDYPQLCTNPACHGEKTVAVVRMSKQIWL
jgi:hypothetical protein